MTNSNLLIALIISIALHVFVVLVFYFANFSFRKEIHDEKILVIDVVKVAETNNIKTQRTEEKTNKDNLEEARKIQQEKASAEHPKNEQVKDKPAQPTKPDALKQPAQEKPKTNKIDEKKPNKDQKSNQKAEDKQKVTKKKQSDIELESLMKTLQKASDGKKAIGRKTAEVQADKGELNAKGNKANITETMTISEYQNIKQQIEAHYKAPVGVRNAGSMKILVYIRLNKDGTVEKVEIKEKTCQSVSGSLCQSAAEFAERAVWLASPLQNLSQQRYNIWKEFNIEFDPSEIAE